MCFPGGGGRHTTRDICFPRRGTYITRDMCLPSGGTHITRDMCFLGKWTHFTREVCFPGEGTHITRDMCFLSRGTHITSDMHSPTWETHIPSDMRSCTLWLLFLVRFSKTAQKRLPYRLHHDKAYWLCINRWVTPPPPPAKCSFFAFLHHGKPLYWPSRLGSSFLHIPKA